MNAAAYLMLGATGSGRRALLLDLIESAVDTQTPVTVAWHEDEPPCPAAQSLAALPQVRLCPWKSVTGQPDCAPPQEGLLFYLTYGRADLADQIEAFQLWRQAHALPVARVLGVVHARLLHEFPELGPWFDAMGHFADCLLINHREGLPNRWYNDFVKPYKDHCFPCLIEAVQKDRVRNPYAVLEPTALRLTQLFEDGDPIDDIELDEDHLPEEPFDIAPKPDPYLERDAQGHRLRPLPDIALALAARDAREKNTP